MLSVWFYVFTAAMAVLFLLGAGCKIFGAALDGLGRAGGRVCNGAVYLSIGIAAMYLVFYMLRSFAEQRISEGFLQLTLLLILLMLTLLYHGAVGDFFKKCFSYLICWVYGAVIYLTDLLFCGCRKGIEAAFHRLIQKLEQE